MQKITTFLTGLAVAAGLAGMGYFIGDGLHSMRPNTRFVSVKGLSEREVMADTASLVISIAHTGATPTEIFPQMNVTQKQVADFLKQFGIKDEEITFHQWKTSRTSADDLKNDPSLPLYEVSGNVSATTGNVGAVEAANRKMNDLRVATDAAVAGSAVSFGFNGIGALRADMIAAATKDARNAALQFAADSGSRVGAINHASQGVFQILSASSELEESDAIRKIVRVVTTVSYELKD